eukprot:3636401-Amphidinium_carterae.1
MVSIEGGAVLGYSSERGAPILGVPCGQEVKLAEKVTRYTRGGVQVEPLSEGLLEQCDWTVEEDTSMQNSRPTQGLDGLERSSRHVLDLT